MATINNPIAAAASAPSGDPANVAGSQGGSPSPQPSFTLDVRVALYAADVGIHARRVVRERLALGVVNERYAEVFDASAAIKAPEGGGPKFQKKSGIASHNFRVFSLDSVLDRCSVLGPRGEFK